MKKQKAKTKPKTSARGADSRSNGQWDAMHVEKKLEEQEKRITQLEKDLVTSKEAYQKGWRDAMHVAITQIGDYKFERTKVMNGEPEVEGVDFVLNNVLRMLNILREEGGIKK